ncbi:MAG: two-component sensor histidine kinase [Flavobacteriaceae bacterium]|nr:two-component sensor histidine kinase [Flavobacteriaceae bacterium]
MVSVSVIVLHIIYFFFFFDIAFSEFGLILLIEFFIILFLVYVILSLSFERFLVSRVKQLYKSLIPTTSYATSINQQEDIEILTSNIKKLNSEKNLEIELLKKEQDYRREFIGNLAHELKTPLFTVQGYILTLLDGVNDKNVIKKYLKQTSKGVDRLIYIIKDLDLITKFESGVASLDRKSFDIIKTVQNVFELLEMQASKQKIVLKFDKEYSEPVIVYADEERIQQVLTNLIINSLKYGVEKGVTEVSIEILKENKILLRIADNGEGIDSKHLPRLFERFYRVDKTRNRNQGGSGLGLAIVKHIIEAHGEKIFVESKVKVGSEFSFSLTLK